VSGAGRLFFALWPSSAQQRDLAQWGAQLQSMCGGRPPPIANLHLTLAFIGDVGEAAARKVLEIGAAQRGIAFDLMLDCTGCWRHNGIAWAAPSQPPPPLLALAAGLEAGLRSAGFDIEQRRYRPHVTLLRRADCQPTDWQPPNALRWRVDRFVLVRSPQSQRASDYERLAEWPLAPDIKRRD
jgi:RNA 2',3'-cyclic 3'-phosphodiesterase